MPSLERSNTEREKYSRRTKSARWRSESWEYPQPQRTLRKSIMELLVGNISSSEDFFFFFVWLTHVVFQLPGKLLQSKGTKDATREAKLLFQRALDIHTAKQGVYHTDTKTIRRALMSLETVDVGAKFSGKGTAKDQELLALDGLRSRPLTKASSRNLDFRQASAS